MSVYQLGNSISKYRKEKKISVRQFAEKCGISPALVSQIENGKANPSLNILNSIAQTIEKPLSTLFATDISDKSIIIKSKDWNSFYLDKEENIFVKTHNPISVEPNAEIVQIFLKPKAKLSNEFINPNVEKLVLIIDGEVQILFDNEEFKLYEGDMIRILPKQKYRFRNESIHLTKLLVINI